MRHADVLALSVGGLNDGDGLGYVVLTLRHNFNDCAAALGRCHDDMITEEIILKDMTKLVTAGDERAWALLEVRDERVESILIE